MSVTELERCGRAEAENRRSERGAALFISMILILILTFIGFGFLTRTLLVTQIAGAERWTTKAFFAADSGINIALARLRTNMYDSFSFPVQDLRGYSGSYNKGDIDVEVTGMEMVGLPGAQAGTGTSGGQTGEAPIRLTYYRVTATAVQPLTRSEAVITSVQGIEKPLDITD